MLSGRLRSARRNSASRTCGAMVLTTLAAIWSCRANRSSEMPSKWLAQTTVPRTVSASSTDTRRAVAGPAHTAREGVGHAHLPPDRAHVDPGAPIAQGGAARDDEQFVERGERADDVLHDALAEVARGFALAFDVEREHGDGGTPAREIDPTRPRPRRAIHRGRRDAVSAGSDRAPGPRAAMSRVCRLAGAISALVRRVGGARRGRRPSPPPARPRSGRRVGASRASRASRSSRGRCCG